MTIKLHLSDIIKKSGLDPKQVMLIRHSLSSKRFATCYRAGFFLEYTCLQKPDFTKSYDYWMVFMGDIGGTTALLKGVYKVIGCIPCREEHCPKDYPYPDDYQEGHVFYQLEELPAFDEFKARLLIDWGASAISWHQSALKEKPIIAIQQYQRMRFPGYEKVILDYSQLKEIVEDGITYTDWHTALSSVSAIYLITDKTNGKQYVGSAYGVNGLLGRWEDYVQTGHGNNLELIEIMKSSPKQFLNFQYSILQIIPKNMPIEAVIELEGMYKRKLLSIRFGMNQN